MHIAKVGFEFEVLVRDRDFMDVWNSIYKLSKHIRLGGDATVIGGVGWRDLEIKTDPLSKRSSAYLFNKIVTRLVTYHYLGQVKANNTRGLHINVSGDEMGNAYSNVLKNYDDVKYLKLWGRHKNPACPALTWKGNEHKYYNDPWEYLAQFKGEKHRSVAFRDSDGLNTVRLENRIIGGKDYMLRTEDIHDTIRDFFKTIESS